MASLTHVRNSIILVVVGFIHMQKEKVNSVSNLSLAGDMTRQKSYGLQGGGHKRLMDLGLDGHRQS